MNTHLAERQWTATEALQLLDVLIASGIAAAWSAEQMAANPSQLQRAVGRTEAYRDMHNHLELIKQGGLIPEPAPAPDESAREANHEQA